jgi:hypothetical protein
MAVVAGEHRAAARLRQVTDKEPAPANPGSVCTENLDSDVLVMQPAN